MSAIIQEYNLAMSIPVFSFGYKEACEKPKQDLKTIVETTVLLEILAGNTSNLYNSLFEQSLINEAFQRNILSATAMSQSFSTAKAKILKRLQSR